MIYQQCTISAEVLAIDDKDGDRIATRWAPGDALVPDSIVLSADGSTLHVNSSNRFQIWQSPTAPARSHFHALDAQTLEEKWRIDLPGQIEHFAASPDKRFVYNAHYDRKVVSKVDTQTREVTLITTPNMGGHKVRVSSDGSKVYVGSIIFASFDEIDATEDRWMRMVTFDDNVRPFALSPDDRTAYVQLNRYHGFKILDLASFEVTGEVLMPGLDGAYPGHEQKYPFTCDHGIEITPDGRYLISLATTGHFLSIFSYPDLQLVTSIKTGLQPSYVTVSKDSSRAYVSCRASNSLMIIDLATMQVDRVIEGLGSFPQRVCVTH